MGPKTGGQSPTTTTDTEAVAAEEKRHNKKKGDVKKLTLLPLIFLVFFEVSGGPYGEEPAVQAAGPFFAILGFLIFPFIWSLPEALVTAELATAFPGNGGYVIWASAAFGPFPGHLMGSWKYLSGVVNSAAYPALCYDYLSRAFPALSTGSTKRTIATVLYTVVLSFFNYLGLVVVGVGGVVLGVLALAPFVLMAGFALPKLRPRRWLARGGGGEIDWSLFLNTLFWNLNYWDNASTLAGEVENPRKTYPRALLGAGLVTCLGYVIPLLAGTGALNTSRDDWGNGFLADAAGTLAGRWLKYWVQAGSVLSSVGLYEAQLSSCVYQLLGMANLGYLPKVFASRSPHFGTPWLAILVSTAITVGISFLSFTEIVAAANFVYSLSMLLEFAAFLWLRHKLPDRHRPYRVPLRLPGLVVMCLVPSAFLIIVMILGNWKVYVIAAGLTAFGVAAYFLNGCLKDKGLIEFEEEENAKNAVDCVDDEER